MHSASLTEVPPNFIIESGRRSIGCRGTNVPCSMDGARNDLPSARTSGSGIANGSWGWFFICVERARMPDQIFVEYPKRFVFGQSQYNCEATPAPPMERRD